jgi:hypothetical protein
VLAPLLGAALLALPLAQGTELAFGFRAGAALTLPFALAALPLWPAWVALSRRFHAFVAAVALAVALASSAALLSRPAATTDDPTWLNLRYVLDVDGGRARFEVATYGAALPRELAALAPFERATESAIPWRPAERGTFVAPAPAWSVAPPELVVTSSVAAGEGRRIRALLRSPRGATRFRLHLGEGAALVAVRRGAPAPGEPGLDGFDPLADAHFFAVPGEGLELEISAPAAPVGAWLMDFDAALPPEMAPLRAARPATAVPRSDGDLSIVGRSVEL